MITAPRPSNTIAQAIRAVCLGVASPGQQRMAMTWIINTQCGVARASFSKDPLEMAFNEGQRAVGIVIFDIAGSRPELIEQDNAGRDGNDDD